MEDLRKLLVPGKIIETRNGCKYLICGENYYMRNEGWIDSYYDEELHSEIGDHDIMKIYHPVHNNLKQIFDDLKDADIIWSRPKERPDNLKDLLRTGMRITIRGGDIYIVFKGSLPTLRYGTQELIFINDNNFLTGTEYNNQLIHVKTQHDYDIIKVETVYYSSLNVMLSSKPLEVIYEEQQN